MSIGPTQTTTYKPACVLDYKPYKPTFMHRHVKWLKGEDEKTRHLFAAILEVVLLSLSILAIPLAVKGILEWRKQSIQTDFNAILKSKTKPETNEVIQIKSEVRTFNHICEYAIEEEVIWHRKRGSNAEWEPMIFDGFPENKPLRIDSDGSNLIVVDDKNNVHYKKVLKEYRVSEISTKGRNRHLNDLSGYVAVDKSSLNNWKSEWFTLPIIHNVVALVSGKRLQVSQTESKQIVISQRGKYNNHIEDKENQKHPVSTGVTNLYALNQDGREIRIFDPWAPKHSKLRLYFPETENCIYRAEKISASASTIMVIGYEINLETKTKQLKIITKLADVDTEGWNPILKFSYFKNVKKPNVRVLPIENRWKEHPLPADAKVTSEITILQIGEGNDARELRVLGQNGENKWGYYKKRLDDVNWEFIALDNPLVNSPILENQIQNTVIEETSTVRNYTGVANKNSWKAELKSFGKRSYHSIIKIQDNEKEYELELHRRHGFPSFLGYDKQKYFLVIPEKYHGNTKLLNAFSNKKTLKVKVRENEASLEIKATKGINGIKFTFKLN